MIKRLLLISLMAVLGSSLQSMADNAIQKEMAYTREVIATCNRIADLAMLAKDQASAQQVAPELDTLIASFGALSENESPKIEADLITPELSALQAEMVAATQRMQAAIQSNELRLDAAIKSHQLSEIRTVLQSMIRDLDAGSNSSFHKKYVNAEQKAPLWNGEPEFEQKRSDLLRLFTYAANVKDAECAFEQGEVGFPADGQTPPTYLVFCRQDKTWKFNIFRKND
jgi:Asp-tRNA(Asn)/Glu-tRNA(Gln) amidotransferase C subunit